MEQDHVPYSQNGSSFNTVVHDDLIDKVAEAEAPHGGQGTNNSLLDEDPGLDNREKDRDPRRVTVKLLHGTGTIRHLLVFGKQSQPRRARNAFVLDQME